MFGIYRFFLATLVILNHTSPTPFHHAGFYAVFSFYMLSGYLMTLVLNERYGFTIIGIGKYLFNRAMRIYPTYWICAGCALLLILAAPWLTWQLNRNIVMPHSFIEWGTNLCIFGMSPYGRARFIPQAWSLYVELLFYLFLGILLARKKSIVVAWFCLSVIYTIYINIAGMPILDRYVTLAAGSLPFSIGALIYFYRNELKTTSRYAIVLSCVLYVANIVASKVAPGHDYNAGFYISVYASALILITLKDIDKKTVPTRLSRMDDTMGNLSYPMYVSHLMMGIFVLWVFFVEPHGNGWKFTALNYCYVLLFSYLIHHFLEEQINRIRDRVKTISVGPGRQRFIDPARGIGKRRGGAI